MINDISYIEIKDHEFNELSQLIKEQCGISIKGEKRGLINCRLQKSLQTLNINNFSEYYDFLLADKSGEAMEDLVNSVTINYTYFMRETAHYKILQELVLPNLKGRIKDYDFRGWCAASSTGEEAYTLAILINEFFGREKYLWNTKILATDISTAVLNVAKEGVYKNTNLQTLPKHWIDHYFNIYDKDSMVLCNEIRKEVIFRRFNLIEKQYPFKKKFHVIFCRNVMIYFDLDIQMQLQEQLYDCLERGGYLFIGHAEILHEEQGKFDYIAPSVYKKI